MTTWNGNYGDTAPMTIKFETYPNYMIDYENDIENVNYDNEMIVFCVPVMWAERWVKLECNMELDEFLSVYTWDDTEAMFNSALIADVVLSEEIAERPLGW